MYLFVFTLALPFVLSGCGAGEDGSAPMPASPQPEEIVAAAGEESQVVRTSRAALTELSSAIESANTTLNYTNSDDLKQPELLEQLRQAASDAWPLITSFPVSGSPDDSYQTWRDQAYDALSALSDLEDLISADATERHQQLNPPGETLVYHFQDEEGYTYTVELSIPGMLEVETEVETQKPGEMLFMGRANPAVSGSVKNTTAGRQARYHRVQVIPVWSSQSKVCEFLDSHTLQLADPNVNRHDYVNLGYCTPLVTVASTYDATLYEQGQNPMLPDGTSELKSSDTRVTWYDQSVAFAGPEADAPSIIHDLERPAFWVMTVDSLGVLGGSSTARCDVYGIPVALTTSGGKDVCPQAE